MGTFVLVCLLGAAAPTTPLCRASCEAGRPEPQVLGAPDDRETFTKEGGPTCLGVWRGFAPQPPDSDSTLEERFCRDVAFADDLYRKGTVGDRLVAWSDIDMAFRCRRVRGARAGGAADLFAGGTRERKAGKRRAGGG